MTTAQHILSSEQYQTLAQRFPADFDATNYPKGWSAASREIQQRGADVSMNMLIHMAKSGAVPGLAEDRGDGRRWTPESIEHALHHFADRDTLTPEAATCQVLNLRLFDFITALRGAVAEAGGKLPHATHTLEITPGVPGVVPNTPRFRLATPAERRNAAEAMANA